MALLGEEGWDAHKVLQHVAQEEEDLDEDERPVGAAELEGARCGSWAGHAAAAAAALPTGLP